jgi:DNA-binding beta-propeller fold protein YncE
VYGTDLSADPDLSVARSRIRGMDRRRFLAAAAAPLVAGVAPEAFARGLGGTPLALVTADLESSVVAVDLSSGRVARRIRTPADPRSIEAVAGGALVAHTALGRLTLVDSRLKVHAIEGELGAPRYAAASPRGRYAYVSDSEREELAVVDLRARRVVGRMRVGGAVRHLSIDRSGRRLWAALGNVAPTVAILDTSRAAHPRLLGTIRPPFAAHDVGFTPGGRRVWLTSGDREALAIHDARTGRLLKTLRGDAPPQHVTFLGERGYVSSGDDGLLRVHRLDGRLLRTTQIPIGSYNVQEGWGRILTPSLSQGTLCLLGERGGLQLKRAIARSSHDACFVVGT